MAAPLVACLVLMSGRFLRRMQNNWSRDLRRSFSMRRKGCDATPAERARLFSPCGQAQCLLRGRRLRVTCRHRDQQPQNWRLSRAKQSSWCGQGMVLILTHQAGRDSSWHANASCSQSWQIQTPYGNGPQRWTGRAVENEQLLPSTSTSMCLTVEMCSMVNIIYIMRVRTVGLRLLRCWALEAALWRYADLVHRFSCSKWLSKSDGNDCLIELRRPAKYLASK